MNLLRTSLFISMLCVAATSRAENKIELETTIIKGNKELPQILYVVPWQEFKHDSQKEQTLVLHSLFGDLFDPVYPHTSNTKQ